jgi:hypothetical protein
MADRFEERAAERVQLLGLENGKAHAHGQVEVAVAPETLRLSASPPVVGTAGVVSEDDLSIRRAPAGGGRRDHRPLELADCARGWPAPALARG